MQDFSLDPDPLTECEMLAVQWQGDGPAAIAIVEQGRHPAQTLLQATLTAPTRSLEWAINATGGAQLDIAVSVQVQRVGIEMDLRRVVEPDLGRSSLFIAGTSSVYFYTRTIAKFDVTYPHIFAH
ncbi:hypothetical protein V8D89_000958 [Ganoderma adspersum]